MSTEQDVDALVVGAGPGGCAAAIELGRAGLKTLVIDRATFPRDKCCGDGLTTGALRRLEALGLDPASVASFTAVNELAVVSPSGRVARLPLGSPTGCAAATARRHDLDAALVHLARGHAEVREGDGFAHLAIDPDGLVVTLASGVRIRTRYLVACDGACWSPVRRALGGGREPMAAPDWYAFRAYAHDVAPRALERLWVSFDPSLLPGYAWSFPVGDAVNLGICFERANGESGTAAAERWRSLLADDFFSSLLGPKARVVGAARAWPIPAGGGAEALCGEGGRVLFVGDAAHAADPFTGEGIAQALETGALAAHAIAGGGEPADVATRYRTLVATDLGRDQRIAGRLRRMLRSRRAARAAVLLSTVTPGTRREIGRWLYEDYPRSAALSPTRWRRSTFTAPPPFATRAADD